VHLSTKNLFSCVVPSFCGVVDCANNAMRNHDKSYHKIPSERERRQAWIQELCRKDLTHVKLKHLKICSDHFITVSPEISSVIRPVLFRTQVSRLQHNLAGLFILIADKRGRDMELIYYIISCPEGDESMTECQNIICKRQMIHCCCFMMKFRFT
jgi:hypothetical protein